MALELKSECIILCEGSADKAFLEKLIEHEEMPFCDILECAGLTKIGRNLKALAADAVGFSKVKGVLIIADSADDVAETLVKIRTQIGSASGFPMPESVGAIYRNGSIALKVHLMPDDNIVGGLETLYVEQICSDNPDLMDCVNTYLECGGNQALSLPAEKLGKARLACIVAAMNREDPSKATRYLIHVDELIKLDRDHYKSIANRLKMFLKEIADGN